VAVRSFRCPHSVRKIGRHERTAPQKPWSIGFGPAAQRTWTKKGPALAGPPRRQSCVKKGYWHSFMPAMAVNSRRLRTEGVVRRNRKSR